MIARILLAAAALAAVGALDPVTAHNGEPVPDVCIRDGRIIIGHECHTEPAPQRSDGLGVVP